MVVVFDWMLSDLEKFSASFESSLVFVLAVAASATEEVVGYEDEVGTAEGSSDEGPEVGDVTEAVVVIEASWPVSENYTAEVVAVVHLAMELEVATEVVAEHELEVAIVEVAEHELEVATEEVVAYELEVATEEVVAYELELTIVKVAEHELEVAIVVLAELGLEVAIEVAVAMELEALGVAFEVEIGVVAGAVVDVVFELEVGKVDEMVNVVDLTPQDMEGVEQLWIVRSVPSHTQ